MTPPKLPRYWAKTAQLVKDDPTSLLYSDTWTAVVKVADVEGTVAMPFDLTREQQLELQRNTEIKENNVLRAKLEQESLNIQALTQECRQIYHLVGGYDKPCHEAVRAKLEAVERERDTFRSKAISFDLDESGIQYRTQICNDLVETKQQLAAAQGRVRELEVWNKRQGDMLSSERGTLNDYKQQRDSFKKQNDILTAALAQAQRETWEQAAKAYERWRDTKYPKPGVWRPQEIEFDEWCRQQAGKD